MKLEKLLSDIELELQDFPLALKLRDHIYQKYRDDYEDETGMLSYALEDVAEVYRYMGNEEKADELSDEAYELEVDYREAHPYWRYGDPNYLKTETEIAVIDAQNECEVKEMLYGENSKSFMNALLRLSKAYADDEKDSQARKIGNMAKNLKASLEGKDTEESNTEKEN